MIVFIDSETTGLDPEHCELLELAIVITNDNLVIQDQFSKVIHQPEETLNQMNDWCKRQHSASGLIDEVLASTLDERLVQIDAVAFLRKNNILSDQQPMAGNTVHFDRAFLKVHMPSLHKYFRYRNIDVSSIQELCKRWGFPESKDPIKGNHRALSDCLNCIEQLRNYKKLFHNDR